MHGRWKGGKLFSAFKQGEVFLHELLRKVLTRKRILIGSAVCIVSAIVLFSVFIITVYQGWWGIIPNKADLERIRTVTATEIISSDNHVLGRIFSKNRTTVPLSKISPDVVNALIATEDARFYEHKGVDRRSLLRVLFKSLILGDRSSGGGSTLSQQLAKNLFPRVDHGPFTMPVAKVREVIVATRIEKLHTKDEILDLYLNTVPFGEETYGIEAASQRFFSKHASNLTLDESAVLIGMLKAPALFNPRMFPQRAFDRRNVVLAQMAKYGVISPEKENMAQIKPLDLNYRKDTQSDGLAPYLREKIKVELEDWLRKHPKTDGSYWDLYNDGLKIYVTIDSRLQTYAEQAMQHHMASLQRQFDNQWGRHNPWGNDASVLSEAVRRSDHYQQLKASGVSDKWIKKIFVTKVKMRIWDWNGEKTVMMSPLDSVKHYLRFLNCGFMAMDPRSGKVLAWIGGINQQYFKYDHVTSQRQAGSLFKPIVYLSALANGVSPFVYYKDERKTYEAYNNWSPKNSDNTYGNYYSMEGALAYSVNSISVEMLLRGGIENAIRLAKKMGIASELPGYASLALGSADVSLREMIEAYSVFANRGSRVDPYYLLKITDAGGNLIHDFTGEHSGRTYVADTTNVDILNCMTRAVVNSGTAGALRYAYGVKTDLAGKTGTSQNQADGWFIGYNPSIVAGCWVGADDPRIHFKTLNLGQASVQAMPVFAYFMQKVNADPSFRKVTYASFHQPIKPVWDKLQLPHISGTGESPYADVTVEGLKQQYLSDLQKQLEEQKQSSSTNNTPANTPATAPGNVPATVPGNTVTPTKGTSPDKEEKK